MADANLAELIQAAEHATAEQRAKLFTALYDELHRVAQRELRRNAALTLSPTTLLHETFLNLSQREGTLFTNRCQFIAYVARVMRGLLIDYVRNRQAQKRGGGLEITGLSTELSQDSMDEVDFDALNEAMESLAKIDPRLAQCVDLKFFCGFSHSEIADMWSVSERTVRRDWDKARILLHRLLARQSTS